MKIATVLFLVIVAGLVILLGAGFISSQLLETKNDLAEANQRIADLQNLLNVAEVEKVAFLQQVQNCEARANEAGLKVNDLQQAVTILWQSQQQSEQALQNTRVELDAAAQSLQSCDVERSVLQLEKSNLQSVLDEELISRQQAEPSYQHCSDGKISQEMQKDPKQADPGSGLRSALLNNIPAEYLPLVLMMSASLAFVGGYGVRRRIRAHIPSTHRDNSAKDEVWVCMTRQQAGDYGRKRR